MHARYRLCTKRMFPNLFESLLSAYGYKFCNVFSQAYASILYLKKLTNFKIILRGKPVEQFSIANDLKHSKKVTYTPQGMGLEV